MSKKKDKNRDTEQEDEGNGKIAEILEKQDLKISVIKNRLLIKKEMFCEDCSDR